MSKVGTFYAILTVQNPYSSGNRDIERSWCSNYQDEECTRAEFLKMAKRSAQRLAERKFYDTLKDGGQVKIFTDREKFVREYHKLTAALPKFID
jgi:hypothetical protein